MKRTLPTFRFGPFLLGICAIWLAAVIGIRANSSAAPAAKTSAVALNGSQSTPSPSPSPQAPTAKTTKTPATYVGEDTCTVCHAPESAAYAKTPHHRAMDPRTPSAAKGCETCHGPGSEHAADPVHAKVKDFKTASSRDINATCASCHKTGDHALWDGSKHESRGLACTTCHSVHNFKSEKAQLIAKTESDVCATCHRDKVTKLDRATHMPVSEGKMTCSSCHNPHGSTNVKLLKKGDSLNDMCTSCHADKRGPFIWEHAPVRQGCVTCHDPHGSQNDSMLVAKLPLLCQRCHISTRHPSTLYDATQLTKPQLEARGCVNCHIQVHGSNHPAGQFFLR